MEEERTCMHLHKKEARTIRKALAEWQDGGFIGGPLAQQLDQSIAVMRFDWKRLAKYSFWIAIICVIVAVTSVFADTYLMAALAKLLDAPYSLKCVVLSAVSAAIYWLAVDRRRKHPENIFSNEAILFLGVLVTAGAIYNFGQAVSRGSGHFSLLILLSCVIYGVIGYTLQSNLVWLFAWLSLGGWMGAETGYISGWGAYYLGMNYPLRFAVLGAVVIAGALLLEDDRRLANLQKTTLIMGLLYLFLSLWIISIFGNYGDMISWSAVKQVQLLQWSVLFAIAAGAAIYHGLRTDNAITKGFGITFLFVNLYTRFFEFFWDALHKAIFFAVLAASFWLLGRRAEKIWNLGQNPAAG
jgi:hypothetical protein